MKEKTLKYIILLAAVSVAGVFLIQFGFLKSSYNYTEKQFRESTSVALKEVAWQLLLASGQTESFDSLARVEMVTGNYFIVNIDADFDKELLKSNLIDQFRKHEIFNDFEFSVYNPDQREMEVGTLISNDKESVSNYLFPKSKKYANYFGVHFPELNSFFVSQLSVWYLLTGLLVIVVLFFGYTLAVIVRQRRLSEVQKNFINNLTHELKTPISSIALASSVLNNPEILNSPDRLFRYAKIIEEQNQRLSKNVEKVLNLATIEKNRINLTLEEIGLTELLNELQTQFKHTSYGQNVSLKMDIPQKDIHILADKFHFSNLVMNILENGVKYCDKQPELQLSLIRRKKRILIRMADNGIGIPKDQRKKIFTKFYRVSTGNVHNVKGFGLGLDYVSKIVKAHKWKIRVDENPGGGSIFTVIIPFEL